MQKPEAEDFAGASGGAAAGPARAAGPDQIPLAGSADALYERHLLFDHVLDPRAAAMRDRFEALARSVRDVLTSRWLKTKETYERVDPKRVYYLSMEFLIGRSLANNVMNLLLDPAIGQAIRDEKLDWSALLDQE